MPSDLNSTLSKHRKLTDDQVYTVLTSFDSLRTLAQRFNVSVSAISNIRLGKSYTSVHPEIPRHRSNSPIPQKFCTNCVHHSIAVLFEKDHRTRVICSLGLPECETLGPRYARECAVFQSLEPPQNPTHVELPQTEAVPSSGR